MRRRCCWCQAPLLFAPDRGGWVHEATGKLYLTYIDPEDGTEKDDHAGLPDWSDSGAVRGQATR